MISGYNLIFEQESFELTDGGTKMDKYDRACLSY